MFDTDGSYKTVSTGQLSTPIHKLTMYEDHFKYSGTQFGSLGGGTNGGNTNGKIFYNYLDQVQYAEFGIGTRNTFFLVGAVPVGIGTGLYLSSPGASVGSWTSPILTSYYKATWEKVSFIDATNDLIDEPSLITSCHFRNTRDIKNDWDVSGNYEITQDPAYPTCFGSSIHPLSTPFAMSYKKVITQNLGSMGEINFNFTCNISAAAFVQLNFGTRGAYLAYISEIGTYHLMQFRLFGGSYYDCGTIALSMLGTNWHQFSIGWKQIGGVAKNLALTSTLDGTTLTGTIAQDVNAYTFKDLNLFKEHAQDFVGKTFGEFYLCGSAVHLGSAAPIQHGTKTFSIRQSDDGTAWSGWHDFAGGNSTVFSNDKKGDMIEINTGTKSYYAQFKISTITQNFYFTRFEPICHYDIDPNEIINIGAVENSIENPIRMGQIMTGGINTTLSNQNQTFFDKEKLFGDNK